MEGKKGRRGGGDGGRTWRYGWRASHLQDGPRTGPHDLPVPSRPVELQWKQPIQIPTRGMRRDRGARRDVVRKVQPSTARIASYGTDRDATLVDHGAAGAESIVSCKPHSFVYPFARSFARSFELVEVLQPRQHHLFARLLNLAGQEDLIEYSVHLDVKGV